VAGWRLGGGQLRTALREQAGFGLGEDAETNQALELAPGALDVLRRDGEIEALAQVPGAHRSDGFGECIKDLLVGRVSRQDRRRIGRFRSGRR
jgi:hypothetical protein